MKDNGRSQLGGQQATPGYLVSLAESSARGPLPLKDGVLPLYVCSASCIRPPILRRRVLSSVQPAT